MENHETWDALDREVAWLITKYHLDQDAGVVGLSFVRTVADFIRERDKRWLEFMTTPNGFLNGSVPAILLVDKDARILSLFYQHCYPAEVF